MEKELQAREVVNKALHSELELECSSRNSSRNEFFAIFEGQF